VDCTQALKGAAWRGHRQLIGRHTRTDIRQRVLAEAVPLDPQFASRFARGLHKAHLQENLLGLEYLDRVDHLRRELTGNDHRFVEGGRIECRADKHDAPVHGRDPDPSAGDAVELNRKTRDVVGHLDVEEADRVFAFVVDRHARGTDLLAQNRERMIGQRRDVGDVRIADSYIRERRVNAHVLGFAHGDIDDGCPLAGIEHDQPILRDCWRSHRNRNSRRCERQRRNPGEGTPGILQPIFAVPPLMCAPIRCSRPNTTSLVMLHSPSPPSNALVPETVRPSFFLSCCCRRQSLLSLDRNRIFRSLRPAHDRHC
jgi:hypothetical protein